MQIYSTFGIYDTLTHSLSLSLPPPSLSLYTHTHTHIHTLSPTHTFAHSNIAEALISKGYATCLRHRQDDDQRSSCYDDLMAAEARALKNTKGVHSKKDAPIHRVADVSQVREGENPSNWRNESWYGVVPK